MRRFTIVLGFSAATLLTLACSPAISIKNEPIVGKKLGARAYARIVDDTGRTMEGRAARVARDIVHEWLEDHDFVRADSAGEADTEIIVAIAGSSSARVVQLRVLMQRYGHEPFEVTRATARLDENDAPYLSKPERIRGALERMLDASMLVSAEIERPDPSSKPGCWPQLGFKAEDDGRVSHVATGSPASSAGLAAGDVIVSVTGTPYSSWRRSYRVFQERVPIVAQYDRDGARKLARMRVEVVCRPD